VYAKFNVSFSVIDLILISECPRHELEELVERVCTVVHDW